MRASSSDCLNGSGPAGSEPGKTLSSVDIEHHRRIVVALSETIRIGAEIDVVIEAHGDWPEAFAISAKET